jgi:hypothetical protein
MAANPHASHDVSGDRERPILATPGHMRFLDYSIEDDLRLKTLQMVFTQVRVRRMRTSLHVAGHLN